MRSCTAGRSASASARDNGTRRLHPVVHNKTDTVFYNELYGSFSYINLTKVYGYKKNYKQGVGQNIFFIKILGLLYEDFA